MDEILALKLQQKEARDKKLQVPRELRNAEKRRQRLKKKAKQLTDADLVEVPKLRDHEKRCRSQRKRHCKPRGLD